MTARIAERLRRCHPYLLSDVEAYNREYAATLRDDLHKVCKQLWKEEVLGGDELPSKLDLPTPAHNGERLTLGSVRQELRDVQR